MRPTAGDVLRKTIIASAMVVAALAATGCGGGGSKAAGLVPKTLTVTPVTASLGFANTLQFTATAKDQNNHVIQTAITYTSSDKRALTVDPNGVACGGVWTPNFLVCNPGRPGIVTVTASAAAGVTATATVYVHPTLDRLEVSALSNGSPCLSQGQTQLLQVRGFSNNIDVTNEMGPATWQVVDSTVAKASTANLPIDQALVTAESPGATNVFASVSSVNSVTSPFITCPVQSITLTGGLSTASELELKTGGTKTVQATVLDSLGATIKPTLSFFSLNPGIATAKTGSVTGVGAGGTAVTAACLPPQCNTNLPPVYATNVLSVRVDGSSKATHVYATSTGCLSKPGCITRIVPIATGSNAKGTAIELPAAPNSFIFSPTGTKAYLGSQAGLMQLDAAGGTVTSFSSVKGKVLAVSNDGNQVAVSDLVRNPNLVSIFAVASSSATQLLLTGVTSAAFSPDGSKLFMASANNLYIFSSTQALQTIPLAAPVSNITFQASGAFAYLGGGTPSGMLGYATCNDAAGNKTPSDTVPLANNPALVAAVPNGTQLLALEPPGVQPISLAITPAGPVGTLNVCPPTVSHNAGSFINLGQGNFTAREFFVSPDARTAFVLSDLPSVVMYSVATGQISSAALVNGASPLSGGLTVNGSGLYVGGTDLNVHRIDVASATDVAQVGVFALCSGGLACAPDLVVVQP